MIHLQLPVPGWLEAVDRLPSGGLVKSFSVQWLAEAVARRADLNTIHRYVNDGLQVVSSDDTDLVRENRARDWFNRFVDGTYLNGSTAGVPHWQAVDFVSWWNEYYANSQSAAEKELWWRQERVAARVWRDEYRNGPYAAKLGRTRLAIGATAVGNDLPIESAITARDYSCVLDYHAYTYWRDGVRGVGDWPNLSGRWDAMERAWGMKPEWLFGESGPYESAIDGWRSPNCLSFNTNAYLEAVRVWIGDVKKTAAYAEGRILGFALFTTGGGAQWQYFETAQPELNVLAEMVSTEWTEPPPPPPPPPPPTGELPYKVFFNLYPQDFSGEEYQQVADTGYARRETIGGSADDAGFLASRGQEGSRVYAWEPERIGTGLTQAWFDARYPGAVMEVRRLAPVFSPPVLPLVVNFPFNDPRDYDGDGIDDDLHEGIDLRATSGQEVMACLGGVVESVNQDPDVSGYGVYVRLRHEVSPGDVWKTWYCHLREALVVVGQAVETGQVVGRADSTGNSTGSHLHLTVQHIGQGLIGYVIDDVVDPAPLLGVNND